MNSLDPIKGFVCRNVITNTLECRLHYSHFLDPERYLRRQTSRMNMQRLLTRLES